MRAGPGFCESRASPVERFLAGGPFSVNVCVHRLRLFLQSAQARYTRLRFLNKSLSAAKVIKLAPPDMFEPTRASVPFPRKSLKALVDKHSTRARWFGLRCGTRRRIGNVLEEQRLRSNASFQIPAWKGDLGHSMDEVGSQCAEQKLSTP